MGSVANNVLLLFIVCFVRVAVKWTTLTSYCSHAQQHCIADLPNLNLPDVCTDSPLRGKAFCKDHCSVLEEKGIPTGLKEFLKYCGSCDTGNITVMSETFG